jgi:demethylmenaquinone methyltransferase/2-methoxy-6-polyprenyl-1,4-benzoquinol methylase
MTDKALAEQVDYYRRRAAEYDATAYGDLSQVTLRVERLVDELGPAGNILEIACGTGIWTAALAPRACTLTAIDAAPETIEIARSRVKTAGVEFEVADVFTWETTRRFDVVFFSAWLSHVPQRRFDEFWMLLRSLLTDGGRVLFIDEHTDEHQKEAYLDPQGEIIERTLDDGSTFRIVKNFIDPEQLVARLGNLGWRCTIHRDRTDWVVGEAHLVR